MTITDSWEEVILHGENCGCKQQHPSLSRSWEDSDDLAQIASWPADAPQVVTGCKVTREPDPLRDRL